MEILIIGLIKIFDNMITTAKNIATYKNKKLAASSLVAISQMLFNTLIKSIVADNSLITDLVVSLCAFIGTYIVMSLNEKLERDTTYTNILTCSITESVEELNDYLVGHGIKCIILDSYSRSKEDTLTVMAFAKTKYESSLIDKFLENSNVKYLRQVIR